MSVELVKLSINDGNEIYQMLQEIPKDENGYINTINGKTFCEYKEWLLRENDLSRSKEIIDGWKVPSSTYWLYVDRRPVGVGKIRYYLTEKLLNEGGHIGYSVCPSERNKGYGKILLGKLINEAANKGIEKVLLTIRNENEYSLKLALANGGIVEKRNDIRNFIWIDCKRKGDI